MPITLVANGDIDSPEKARLVLDYTGADAIMIGRAARGRPWIFQQIAHYLSSGLQLPTPRGDRVKQIVLEHLQDLYHLYGESRGVRIARKHVARYWNGRGDAKQFVARFNRVETPKEQQDLIEGFFNEPDRREDRAA